MSPRAPDFRALPGTGKSLLILLVMALVVAACGGTADETTTTAAAPDTTTTTEAAPGTTAETSTTTTTTTIPDLGEITVAVGASQSIDFAPAELAIELGMWEKRGLTVNNVFVRGGGEVARLIAAEEAQIGITTGPSTVSPIVKGLPSRIVAAASLDWVGFVIIVGADSDIQTLADLEGKTIGFSRPGSTTDYVAEKVAAAQGWTMNVDVFKASVGGLPEMMAALQQGSIDAFSWTPEPAYALEEEGQAKVIGNMGDIIGANVFMAIQAGTDLIENNPEVVQAYLEGWMETVQWMNDNPEEAITWMSESWEMSEAAIAKAFEVAIANMSLDGVIPEANLAGLAQTVAELDEDIETPPAAADFYDPRFVPVVPS